MLISDDLIELTDIKRVNKAHLHILKLSKVDLIAIEDFRTGKIELGLFVENDITNFATGYIATDLNGDGNVDLLDIPSIEDNITNFIFSNHP